MLQVNNDRNYESDTNAQTCTRMHAQIRTFVIIRNQ